jgi:hypothetical protein
VNNNPHPTDEEIRHGLKGPLPLHRLSKHRRSGETCRQSHARREAKPEEMREAVRA